MDNEVQFQSWLYTPQCPVRDDGWDWGSTSRASKMKTVAVYDVTEGKREREREP